MDIIFHAHHATVSDRMRERAAAGVRRLTERVDGAVDAIIRFEEDGRVRRVEIILHAPRHTRLVASSEGRYFGPAIAETLAKLQKQIASTRRTARSRAAGMDKAARA